MYRICKESNITCNVARYINHLIKTLCNTIFIVSSNYLFFFITLLIDGSSGGVIRLVIITESGIEKQVILGDQLPFM